MLTIWLKVSSIVLVLTACASATHTQVPIVTEGKLTFAVIGDYGQDNSAEAAVAALVSSWNVDFVVTVGDNNYSTGSETTIDQNIGQYYHSFIGSYHGLFGAGSSMPRFYPILGNHDWQSIVCNQRCSGPYLEYFTLPGNERYYEVQNGDLHLFFLDSDPREPDGNTANSRQSQWLQQRLTVSQAAHKIVLLHHPPFSSGLHGSTSDLQWPFEAWGATAVIAGHEHSYERLEVGGIPMFVNGLGGATKYRFGKPLSQSQVRYASDYGAMLVVVNDQEILFQFINRKGELIDSFTQIIAKESIQ